MFANVNNPLLKTRPLQFKGFLPLDISIRRIRLPDFEANVPGQDEVDLVVQLLLLQDFDELTDHGVDTLNGSGNL
jgi:hypothetical protein